MAKIFISYKYGDKHVRQDASSDLGHWENNLEGGDYQTVRSYVDHLMETVLINHINKAEKDDEDLSHLSDDTIEGKLFDRIWDSSLTIVLISKNMKVSHKEENDQWIARELSYSLKSISRADRTSHPNGILAIALPDENDSYDYAVVDKDCGVRQWKTNHFFEVIQRNMFNRNDKKHAACSSCSSSHHTGNDHSYIHPVKWDDFIDTADTSESYITHALDLKNRIEEFEIEKIQ